MNEVRFDDELQFAKVVLKWTLLKLTKILIFCATQQKYDKIIAKRKRYILIQYTTFTKYNLYLKYRKNIFANMSAIFLFQNISFRI